MVVGGRIDPMVTTRVAAHPRDLVELCGEWPILEFRSVTDPDLLRSRHLKSLPRLSNRSLSRG